MLCLKHDEPCPRREGEKGEDTSAVVIVASTSPLPAATSSSKVVLIFMNSLRRLFSFRSSASTKNLTNSNHQDCSPYLWLWVLVIVLGHISWMFAFLQTAFTTWESVSGPMQPVFDWFGKEVCLLNCEGSLRKKFLVISSTSSLSRMPSIASCLAPLGMLGSFKKFLRSSLSREASAICNPSSYSVWYLDVSLSEASVGFSSYLSIMWFLGVYSEILSYKGLLQRGQSCCVSFCSEQLDSSIHSVLR